MAYELPNYIGKNKGGVFRKMFCVTENDVLRKHQIFLRKSEYYTNVNNKLLSTYYKVKLFRLQNKYALHIPLNCCGRGLKIMHLGPILMNGGVTVGKDVSIHMNVALVAGGGYDGAPGIGNGCVIGYGACVVGKVWLANNIAVGAGAVVTKSFMEENVAIAGVPAKKVSNKGRLEWK